ncbi:MAG TPA: CDP-alcohol phosphatidyltransferase family protein [Acidimicrobiales bacterium]|nr:CDP-alcohol phosphatidyltransferase family protein [Acidimicrobiales bacterium]
MARTGEDRVLTIPNVLTVVRLSLIPVFLWLLLAREDRYAAGLLLAALGTTDFVDGYLARHLHQESRLGKILDPTADRLLLGTAVVAILIDGSVPLWVALLAAAREALVGLGVLLLVALGARDVIDVKLVGKAGTLTLMVAFPLFLASNPDGGAPWHELARPLAWAFVVPGLVLSWIAAAGYVAPARAALARRSTGRPAGGTG